MNLASPDTIESWSLSAEPSVVIGGTDEREDYLLHQVIEATRLGDGRIVIANARKRPPEDTGPTSWDYIYPDHYPRYARLVAAPEDRVWVMAYPRLKDPVMAMELDHPVSSRRLKEGAWWKMVGRDGFPIAELRTPPRFFLLEVGDDHVLGLSMDEFLRESVRLYRLIR